MIFTREQIKEIQAKIIDAGRIHVSCDEYHAHSALNDCIVGEEDAVIICKLCETAMGLYDRGAEAIEIIKGEECEWKL